MNTVHVYIDYYILYVVAEADFSNGAEFLPGHDGALNFTIAPSLNKKFIKIKEHRKI